ncbi:MAG TPA: heparan-alpha-glucosaminide N-acetyltransferase domain-containing protein [Vicinamibacterales bacterium]|nr:heparan-alpha-glucosaminide N-acetyltransferase domain-containing protein [Vicinamibacterales bacterium]
MPDLPPAPGHVSSRRRGYLDWLRGIAVLIMIEAHVVDSWTEPADRDGPLFGGALILGGFGAPLFLFLAGVAVSMSAGSKSRRGGDQAAAARAVVRRGLEIFGLAFLFRLQAWVLGWSSPRALLKVDILNIMGPSIMAAAALWGSVRKNSSRVLVFTAATSAVAFLTPSLRNATFIVALPAPIEAYFRPVPGLTNFVFLPWAAFVFGGAAAGVLIDMARDPVQERRLNVMFAIGGGGLALGAFALSYYPTPFAASYFWTTSPAFFFLRLGLMIAGIAAAYAWESRPGGRAKWSPVQQLGRTSLFIYWIHVEMVYGLVSRPLHHALALPRVGGAYGLFVFFMLGCSILKDRIVNAWKRRRASAAPAPQRR